MTEIHDTNVGLEGEIYPEEMLRIYDHTGEVYFKSKFMNQRICIVVVNWNQKVALELMLKSFIVHHYKGNPLELIVVDNGSSDGSKEWVKENKIPAIFINANIGHEQALNYIFPLLKQEIILFADSDIEFFDNVYEKY